MSTYESTMSIPELVVEAPPEDFGPSTIPGAGRTTLTLNARSMRDKISHQDLAGLTERFGSLRTLGELGKKAAGQGGAGGVRMLRDESGWNMKDLAEDEIY